MIDLLPLLVLAVAAGLGGVAQGTTGIGFALVAAPACALVLEPHDVVGTVVRLGLVVDVVLALRLRRAVDVRTARTYLLAAAVAVPVGAAVTATAPERAVVVLLAGVTLAAAALLWTAGGARAEAVVAAPARGTRVVAGFASGFMGVTAGMPGPPVAIDSARRGVAPAEARATLAVFFACVDLLASATHPDAVPLPSLAVLAAAALFGLGAAAALSHRVDEARARSLVVLLVSISAAGAILRQLL